MSYTHDITGSVESSVRNLDIHEIIERLPQNSNEGQQVEVLEQFAVKDWPWQYIIPPHSIGCNRCLGC